MKFKARVAALAVLFPLLFAAMGSAWATQSIDRVVYKIYYQGDIYGVRVATRSALYKDHTVRVVKNSVNVLRYDLYPFKDAANLGLVIESGNFQKRNMGLILSLRVGDGKPSVTCQAGGFKTPGQGGGELCHVVTVQDGTVYVSIVLIEPAL